MAVMRDRLRILGALLAAAVLGLGSEESSATVRKKATTKKKAKKKTATRKKAAKKKATKKKATKKKTTKKKPSKKKANGKKRKKKAKKKKRNGKKPMKVAEPGALALLGTGVAAAGIAHKLGRRRKSRHANQLNGISQEPDNNQ